MLRRRGVNGETNMKMWATIIKNHKRIAEATEELAEKKPSDVERWTDAIDAVCKELDLPRPVILSKHERDLRQFSHVVFKPSDFIEPVAFDTFELTLFYEKKKEEPTE